MSGNPKGVFMSTASGPLRRLEPRETPVLDRDRVEELFIDLGEVDAQAVVSATLNDMRKTLERLYNTAPGQLKTEGAALAAEVAAQANSIGLLSAHLAALNVQACAAQNRALDLPATLARLHRLLNAPLEDDWYAQATGC